MTATDRRRTARAAARLRRLLSRERELWASGLTRVAGVDEAGVGPLAGPIVAAAVVFPPGTGLRGVNDSKRLTARQREGLALEIRASAAACCVVAVSPQEIDRFNVYHAGLMAKQRAVTGLATPADYVLVDGRGRVPDLAAPQETVIGGDARCHAIAAASILAKCERDALMAAYDAQYPGYGFAEHKGYPTAEHRAAIARLGPTPIHRRSFTLLPQPRLFD